MVTLSLVSRKGGCGKSTLATSIAAYFSRAGLAVTLGDVDHQQSVGVWLRNRPATAPYISSWTSNLLGPLRPPRGAPYFVLDTPGGIHGLALSKVIMLSDLVLMPVAGSVFDRESAADCWAELRKHPRIVSGRCTVVAMGMRLDQDSDEEQLTAQWARDVGLPWLGWIRRSNFYVRAAENGLSIFDMPGVATPFDLMQWDPLLTWLRQNGFAAASLTNTAQKIELPLKKPVMNGRPTPTTEAANNDSEVTQLSRWVPKFLLR
jgi:chromosome partitioning protein